MPFKRAHSFKLMLAVAAALSASQAAAQDDQRLWNCNTSSSGEWDCEVNETLMQEAGATAAPEARSSASTTPSENTATASSSQAEKPSEPQKVTGAAPPAAPRPQASAPAPASRSTASRTETAAPAARANESSEPSAESTSRQVTTQQVAAGDRYDQFACTVDNGQWVCTQNPVARSSVAPAAGAKAVAQNYAYLDWYRYTPGEEGFGGACAGEYREPALNLGEAKTLEEQQTIFLEALRSSTVLGGTTQLQGGINMRQGQRLLTSDEAIYDAESQTASLDGKVTYREPGLLMVGESARADLNAGHTSFHNAEYVMHQEHLRGSANSIERFVDARVVMNDGRITFCEPGNNDWAIAADDLEIHTEEGYGEARHATFEVADIPVLYLPYFYFPIDDTRRSGFLYPSVGYSDTDGLDIATPYYFNLAPNYDDTFTPRYVSERGLVLENEFRYMNTWSMNTLSTAYINDDDLYGDSRWALGIEHNGNPADNWFTRIDYRRISDDDYLDDLDTTNLEIAKEDDLDQIAMARYEGDGWTFTGKVHKYQTIDGGREPYEQVPQFALTGQEVIANTALFAYQAEYTYFDRDNDDTRLTEEERVIGSRFHVRPSISYSWDRPWASVKPRLTYWYSQYDLSDQPENWSKAPSLGIPIASLDSTLKFERGYGADLTQTLEPRIKLIHTASEDQSEIPNFDSERLDLNYYNLFNETGYSGNDKVAGTSQATVGLSSAFYSQAGLERARVGVAQAYYFEDRDEETGFRPGDVDGTESRSNLAVLASWNITPELRFAHDSELDDSDNLQMVQQNYRLSYQPDESRLIYLSYRDNSGSRFDSQRDKDENEIRQTDFAFRWPISDQWGMIGRWQEDLLRDENIETLLGVEYTSCCWKIRVTGRQWVDDTDNIEDIETDTGIFFEFVLRGLGSFGQSGGREFLEDITGKEEDARNAF
ncbi:LPS-assembly protein [Marinobacterium mangrovicola]|uniref:LPS-assembly protein LptD n=2 Tax=Marinobacterium mangrovicola TaxID=1476959 RepID=A0A4R1GJ85_9GAMM|nr:LPS-assembly protein [Marinobacterium mangrovicola]